MALAYAVYGKELKTYEFLKFVLLQNGLNFLVKCFKLLIMNEQSD